MYIKFSKCFFMMDDDEMYFDIITDIAETYEGEVELKIKPEEEVILTSEVDIKDMKIDDYCSAIEENTMEIESVTLEEIEDCPIEPTNIDHGCSCAICMEDASSSQRDSSTQTDPLPHRPMIEILTKAESQEIEQNLNITNDSKMELQVFKAPEPKHEPHSQELSTCCRDVLKAHFPQKYKEKDNIPDPLPFLCVHCQVVFQNAIGLNGHRCVQRLKGDVIRTPSSGIIICQIVNPLNCFECGRLYGRCRCLANFRCEQCHLHFGTEIDLKHHVVYQCPLKPKATEIVVHSNVVLPRDTTPPTATVPSGTKKVPVVTKPTEPVALETDDQPDTTSRRHSYNMRTNRKTKVYFEMEVNLRDRSKPRKKGRKSNVKPKSNIDGNETVALPKVTAESRRSGEIGVIATSSPKTGLSAPPTESSVRQLLINLGRRVSCSSDDFGEIADILAEASSSPPPQRRDVIMTRSRSRAASVFPSLLKNRRKTVCCGEEEILERQSRVDDKSRLQCHPVSCIPTKSTIMTRSRSKSMGLKF